MKIYKTKDDLYNGFEYHEFDIDFLLEQDDDEQLFRDFWTSKDIQKGSQLLETIDNDLKNNGIESQFWYVADNYYDISDDSDYFVELNISEINELEKDDYWKLIEEFIAKNTHNLDYILDLLNKSNQE